MIELPEPEPGERKYGVVLESWTSGGAILNTKSLKHMALGAVPTSDGALSIEMIAPLTVVMPKSFAVMNQRALLYPALG